MGQGIGERVVYVGKNGFDFLHAGDYSKDGGNGGLIHELRGFGCKNKMGGFEPARTTCSMLGLLYLRNSDEDKRAAFGFFVDVRRYQPLNLSLHIFGRRKGQAVDAIA